MPTRKGGSLPKDPAERRRRNAEVRTTIDAGPRPKARPFPKTSRAAPDPRVKGWWTSWVESPVVQRWESTDWQRLEALVPIVQGYWSCVDEGDAAMLLRFAAELRLQESLLGATLADRLRNKLDIVRPEVAKPVVEDNRRERLRIVETGN